MQKNLYLSIIIFLYIFPMSSAAQDFILQTDEAGFRTVNNTNGIAIADYDQDGDLDVYFVGRSAYKPDDMRTWNRLFSSKGDGTYKDVTSFSGLLVTENDTLYNTGGNGSKLGAFWGDYDNDGYPDLFVTNYGPNQLFHNNGDNTFSDVTEESVVSGGATYLSTGAVWFDYDLDGDLDLYVCNWKNFNNNGDQNNWMYENVGDGIFEDVSLISGVADSGKTYATVAIDANNDGYLDLYLANDFGHNRFYENKGDKTFEIKTDDYNLTNGFHGMGLAVGDVDQNGYFDIYLTNATEDQYDDEINALYLNSGENQYVNNSVSAGVSLAGWGWGADFVDIENDGDEDLFVVTGFFFPEFSNRLFRNISDQDSLIFEDITAPAGLADYDAAHGMAVFDYDDDGDQDLLISNVGDAPFLYSNKMVQGNWLNIQLEGTETNRSAFGTVVELEVGGQTYKKYHHGAQFQAQNVLPVHCGLGDAEIVNKITVYWLNGQIDEFESVSVNQSVKIIEGGDLISIIDDINENHSKSPKLIHLVDNFPNPFNGSTQIRFNINIPGQVELRIFNTLGQSVQIINNTYSSQGEKTIIWNADDYGIGSGIYFYRIKIEDHFSNFGKMVLLK